MTDDMPGLPRLFDLLIEEIFTPEDALNRELSRLRVSPGQQSGNRDVFINIRPMQTNSAATDLVLLS